MMVTPVAKVPSALRKSRGSIGEWSLAVAKIATGRWKQHVDLLVSCFWKGFSARYLVRRTGHCSRWSIVLGGRRAAQLTWLYPAPIDERDRRIEDHTLAGAQSGVYFQPCAQVACDPDGANLSFAILDDGHLQAVAVEEQSLRRNGEGRHLARYLELDRAIDSWRQRTVRIGDIDFGQERAGAALQRVGDPGHLASKLAIRQFGHAHDRINARCNTECCVLRHIDPHP